MLTGSSDKNRVPGIKKNVRSLIALWPNDNSCDE